MLRMNLVLHLIPGVLPNPGVILCTFFPKMMAPDGPGHSFRLGTVFQKDQTLIIILTFTLSHPKLLGWHKGWKWSEPMFHELISRGQLNTIMTT